MAGNITSTSRIPIVPPGSPDVIGFLIDSEIVMAKHPLQLYCHTETGDASTNDDNFLGGVHVAGIDFIAIGVPVLWGSEKEWHVGR
jgi:hypothetical protein